MKFISKEESEKLSPADDAREYESTIAGVSAFMLGAGFLGTVLVLGYQIYQWLKTGVWIAVPFYFLFTWLKIDLSVIGNMEWQGIKKILIWLLELPLSLMSIALGGVLAYLFAVIFRPK
jgi:hypothetical protein